MLHPFLNNRPIHLPLLHRSQVEKRLPNIEQFDEQVPMVKQQQQQLFELKQFHQLKMLIKLILNQRKKLMTIQKINILLPSQFRCFLFVSVVDEQWSSTKTKNNKTILYNCQFLCCAYLCLFSICACMYFNVM